MPVAPDGFTIWAQLLSQVGFPILVAGYLLTRVVPALARLTSAIEQLVQLMSQSQRAGVPRRRSARIPAPRPRSSPS
jgi:hypothetical protein